VIALDSSAVLAILIGEPEAERFARIIANADGCLLSAVSYLETALVLIGRGPVDAAEALDALAAAAAIEIVPFGGEQARAARDAFVCFGKGRHPAGLNMGDCAAYALARTRGVPLLFKGDDFSRTDVERLPV
jgi:ribonuclease VapC